MATVCPIARNAALSQPALVQAGPPIPEASASIAGPLLSAALGGTAAGARCAYVDGTIYCCLRKVWPDDGSHIEPILRYPDIREVGDPFAVGSSGFKGAVENARPVFSGCGWLVDERGDDRTACYRCAGDDDLASRQARCVGSKYYTDAVQRIINGVALLSFFFTCRTRRRAPPSVRLSLKSRRSAWASRKSTVSKPSVN
jgi:hypothetical protein